MKKPTDIALWLHASWPITSIAVSYDQTGTDTAETNVTIRGSKGQKRLRWDTIEKLVEVQVRHNSVMDLRDHVKQECTSWLEFSRQNAKELAEYERLKTKFEGPGQ